MSTSGAARGTGRRGASQRFGHVSDRHPNGTGPGGRLGTYFVRDDESLKLNLALS